MIGLCIRYLYIRSIGGWIGMPCSISVRNERIFLQEGDMYLSFLISVMVHTHLLHLLGAF